MALNVHSNQRNKCSEPSKNHPESNTKEGIGNSWKRTWVVSTRLLGSLAMILLRNPQKLTVNSSLLDSLGCNRSFPTPLCFSSRQSPQKKILESPIFLFLFLPPYQTHSLEFFIANNSPSTWGVFLSRNFILCTEKTLFLNFKQYQSMHII